MKDTYFINNQPKYIYTYPPIIKKIKKMVLTYNHDCKTLNNSNELNVALGPMQL
jgi:hypothetical protein